MNTLADILCEHPPTILGRTELERYVNCPAQGAMVDADKTIATNSADTEPGQECHDVISGAVKQWTTPGVRMSRKDVAELIIEGSYKSRPDVQPSVVAAVRRGAYPIADILCKTENGEDRSPDDVIIFDGGEGERSGQLAWDVFPATETTGAVRLTAELDLMLTSASVEEVEVWDWKSGHRWWTATDVAASFQFQMQAWLVLRNFPQVNSVHVRVFMVREGLATGVVTFRRKDVYAIEQRLKRAVDIYLETKAKPVGEAETWPILGKCSICPAVRKCPAACGEAKDIGGNIVAYLAEYAATQEKADYMKGELTKLRRASAVDIEGNGVAFGDPPRAKKQPIYKLYDTGSSSEE